MKVTPTYEVLVGNIGIVTLTKDRGDALKDYKIFQRKSILGEGKGAYEPVCLMKDGETELEHGAITPPSFSRGQVVHHVESNRDYIILMTPNLHRLENRWEPAYIYRNYLSEKDLDCLDITPSISRSQKEMEDGRFTPVLVFGVALIHKMLK